MSTPKNGEVPDSASNKTRQVKVFLEILKENNTHIRHVETERMIFLPAASAIFAAILVGITRGAAESFVTAAVILL